MMLATAARRPRRLPKRTKYRTPSLQERNSLTARAYTRRVCGAETNSSSAKQAFVPAPTSSAGKAFSESVFAGEFKIIGTRSWALKIGNDNSLYPILEVVLVRWTI